VKERSILNRSLLILFAGLLATTSALVPPVYGATWTVKAQPAQMVNGSPVLLEVKPPAPLASLTGSWLNHPLTFSFSPTTKTWFTLAGVSFETAPGTYTLELTGQRVPIKTADDSAIPVKFSRALTVGRGKYPKTNVSLGVPGKYTEPSPEQVQEIAESKKTKDDYLNRVTPNREWDRSFDPPAKAETSDVFGSQRIFNGKALSTHLGLDFRVPTGTPVDAMNDGVVLLARPLYFEGNFVVIDHGQGLLTLYLHLSEFKVKEGEHVKRGQEIALSGGTGRATGPHLHVAVRWQGTYLDPAQLFRITLP
jgi:murein DD-endopeptidase MepM/ murein hydrolase activator NlpD